MFVPAVSVSTHGEHQMPDRARAAASALPHYQANGVRLSVILPAWNAQATIRQAIQEADATLAALVDDYEIIVVDDGSTDDTAALVRAEAAANPLVRLIQHPNRVGGGAALRSGSQAASLDLVAFTDADGQCDLGELASLLSLARRHDIVCGYRIDCPEPASRRLLSWGYNTLAQGLVGSPVRDVNCPLKVFHRAHLPALLPECDHSFAPTEMLARARLQGLSVVEVGVRQRPSTAGRAQGSLRDIPRLLSALLRFWWTRTLFAGEDAAPAKLNAWFWLALAVLALVTGSLLFPNLAYPLVEPDEGRFAEVGREMARSGDWLVPTINHRPYYDKPPLFHWLVASSLLLFGKAAWAARLVPAMATFVTLLATFLFGTRIVGTRAAFLSALVLALMVGFVQCGRMVIVDSVLCLFVSTSLFTAYEAVRGERVRWGWWLLSAGLCGLGMLTKGPVAFVLLAPPVAAFAWLNRRASRPTWLHWLAFAGLALSVVAPWYAAVMAHDRHFAYYFFVEHNIKRFVTSDYHNSPAWFYLPVLLVGLLPWSGLFPALGWFLFGRSAVLRDLRPRALGFIVLWAGWGLLFFSLSHGKLPTYILPTIPAFALLLGCYLEPVLFRPELTGFFEQARTRWPRQAVLLLATIWIGGNIWAWSQGLVDLGRHPVRLAEIALCGGVIAGLILWGRKLPCRAAWLLCSVMALALLLKMANDFVPAWSAQRSPLARSEEIRELLGDGATAVACIGEDWGSIPFYLDQDERYFNGTLAPPCLIRLFLSQHTRNLLVVKPEVTRDMLQRFVPTGMAITRVMKSGRTRVFLVQGVADSDTAVDAASRLGSEEGQMESCW